MSSKVHMFIFLSFPRVLDTTAIPNLTLCKLYKVSLLLQYYYFIIIFGISYTHSTKRVYFHPFQSRSFMLFTSKNKANI